MPTRKATDEETIAFAKGEFKPEDSEFRSPLEDGVSDKVAEALANSVKTPDPPDIPDTGVRLPGGINVGDHSVNSATVRELTGEDEEFLAKAIMAKRGSNLFHFLNVLLECGVERFGSEDPTRTKKLLKNALVGDRDALIIGISRATYGDDIEMSGWECPGCGENSDLEIPLDDIPVRELEEDGPVFDVELKRGRSAKVRLANGSDQLAIFEDDRLTGAERDTIMISRCLISLRDKDGTEHTTAGFASTYARKLSAPDRHVIVKALNDKQPGPQFGDLKIRHELCGEEVEVLIGISDLFPGLRMV